MKCVGSGPILTQIEYLSCQQLLYGTGDISWSCLASISFSVQNKTQKSYLTEDIMGELSGRATGYMKLLMEILAHRNHSMNCCYNAVQA